MLSARQKTREERQNIKCARITAGEKKNREKSGSDSHICAGQRENGSFHLLATFTMEKARRVSENALPSSKTLTNRLFQVG